MIDKELFRKIEGRLYKFYNQIKVIEKLKKKIDLLYLQKEQIEKEKVELRKLNTEICAGMGIDYSVERVQSSTNCSSEAERNIIKYIDELDVQFELIVRKISETRMKIREIEIDIYDIEYSLNMLDEELRRFSEWKYGENKSVEWIGIKMYAGATSTAYRKREDIVTKISHNI